MVAKTDTDSPDSTYTSCSSDEEPSNHHHRKEASKSVIPNYLTFALCCLKQEVDKTVQNHTDLPVENISEDSSACDDENDKLSSYSKGNSTDIYEKLFGSECTVELINPSIQNKGVVFSLADSYSSSLILQLPKEFISRSNVFDNSVEKYINRKIADLKDYSSDSYMENSSSRGQESECSETGKSESTCEQKLMTRNMKTSGDCEAEIHVNRNPETKLIQTRSGRKTHFTFFSKTFDSDLEEDTDEDTLPKPHSNSASLKQLKPDKMLDDSLCIPKRKRGRPRKQKDDDTAPSTVFTSDMSPDINHESSQSKAPLRSRSESKTSNTDKSSEMQDCTNQSIYTFFEQQQEQRVNNEVELCNILNKQQKEEADVLKDVFDIFKDIQQKYQLPVQD